MENKKCFKCLETKEIAEFYKHPQMKDGHLNKCKCCAKKDSSTKDPELYERRKKRDRNRKNHKERIDNNKKYLSWLRENDPEKYKKHIESKKKWAEKNKHKRRAHNKVARALLSGKLKRPVKCTKCDIVDNLEAHHRDYSKPLEVEWLCIPCHNKEHKIDKE